MNNNMSTNKQPFSTPYSRAWKSFTETADFERIMQSLLKSNPNSKRQYVETGIRSVFNFAWNAKTSHILESLEKSAEIKIT